MQSLIRKVVGLVLTSGLCLGLLNACGGASDVVKTVAPQASASISSAGANTVTYAPLDQLAFIDVLKMSNCNDKRNRLFVIESIASEEKLVLWARDGSCSDNAYARTLYSGKPENILCETHDSIAGPQSSCKDEKYKNLFSSVTQNLEQIDLGLDKPYFTSEIFMPIALGPMSFEQVDFNPQSGITIRGGYVSVNPVTMPDLWKMHTQSTDPKASLPDLNYNKKMLLFIAMGNQTSECYTVRVRQIVLGKERIQVTYNHELMQTFAPCEAKLSTPTAVFAIDRSNLPVEFIVVP